VAGAAREWGPTVGGLRLPLDHGTLNTVATPDALTYTYAALADRVEAVLGTRPALSTLRTAATRAALGWDYPPRVTAGMPSPLPSTPPAPTRFDASQIEIWLASHPWKRQHQALEQITEIAAGPQAPLRAAVAAARASGASWTAITDALNAGGWPHSRAWAYKTFRDL
jgi:hypothetical protein